MSGSINAESQAAATATIRQGQPIPLAEEAPPVRARRAKHPPAPKPPKRLREHLCVTGPCGTLLAVVNAIIACVVFGLCIFIAAKSDVYLWTNWGGNYRALLICYACMLYYYSMSCLGMVFAYCSATGTLPGPNSRMISNGLTISSAILFCISLTYASCVVAYLVQVQQLMPADAFVLIDRFETIQCVFGIILFCSSFHPVGQAMRVADVARIEANHNTRYPVRAPSSADVVVSQELVVVTTMRPAR